MVVLVLEILVLLVVVIKNLISQASVYNIHDKQVLLFLMWFLWTKSDR